ncbi:hypothetical protein L1987_39691 [Smallanthus sonchifolius]|uniref:Uncharacterized protein n=1 Tax=Smallanthus sonchifolius TaxID=185202 RepID=A0ACB9HMH7_9ASTR|nr:hypothetical protein L1987_39691 [Smallanthus sonchifolius]
MVHDSCLQGLKTLVTDFDLVSKFTIHGQNFNSEIGPALTKKVYTARTSSLQANSYPQMGDFSIHACDNCLHTYRTCFSQSERAAALATTILAAREHIEDNCNSNGEVGIEQTTETLKMQSPTGCHRPKKTTITTYNHPQRRPPPPSPPTIALDRHRCKPLTAVHRGSPPSSVALKEGPSQPTTIVGGGRPHCHCQPSPLTAAVHHGPQPSFVAFKERPSQSTTDTSGGGRPTATTNHRPPTVFRRC